MHTVLNTFTSFHILKSLCDMIVSPSVLSTTPFVLVYLSSIPCWDVPKYCHVSKNRSH